MLKLASILPLLSKSNHKEAEEGIQDHPPTIEAEEGIQDHPPTIEQDHLFLKSNRLSNRLSNKTINNLCLMDGQKQGLLTVKFTIGTVLQGKHNGIVLLDIRKLQRNILKKWKQTGNWK